VNTPPLEPLLGVLDVLGRAGHPCYLGGSGLLAALGLADLVHDWDVTTDASIEEVTAALAGFDVEPVGNSGVHADHKAMLPAQRVEVIARFAFAVEGGVVRIPNRVSATWRGVPVGSPEGWAVAYALLGRPAKSGMLFGHLARTGADDATCRRLLAQPLPPGLAERVAALPRA
jgi:hypothetical protein